MLCCLCRLQSQHNPCTLNVQEQILKDCFCHFLAAVSSDQEASLIMQLTEGAYESFVEAASYYLDFLFDSGL